MIRLSLYATLFGFMSHMIFFVSVVPLVDTPYGYIVWALSGGLVAMRLFDMRQAGVEW